MKPILKAATLLSLFTILFSCSTTEPIPIDENIKLTEVDAAVIEAYLNIHVENPSTGKEVVLERNGQRVIGFTANKTDTAITDTGLTENTVYQYKAKLTEKGNVIGESSEVSIRTMQPTSHNFTWQTFTFGEHSSSSLNDVAIIDENNIWAVGEIYTKDSTGQVDPIPYNSIHWDGKKWELIRIQFYTICGQASRTPYPAKSILALSENNIWITAGDQITRLEWNLQKETMCLPFSFSVNKLWGENQNSLYAVGNNGNIAHYNGTSWQKIESGSELTIQDIWGALTVKNEILCLASEIYNNVGTKLMKIENNTATVLNTDGLPWSLSSIWFTKGKKYYTAGDGIYEKHDLTEKKWKNILGVTSYYINRIRGNDVNDMIAVGAYGEFLHYNGKTWESYIASTYVNGGLKSASIKDNLAVAVGTKDRQAVIIVGKR